MYPLGYTPLHWASEGGLRQVGGAATEQRKQRLHRPKWCASCRVPATQTTRLDVVKLLVEAGSCLVAYGMSFEVPQTHTGERALGAATRGGHHAVAAYLSGRLGDHNSR
eukprot:TRINITY_DN7821_c0_g2_i1.p1 TRINITY_DN7821_c0_g2~~TRINITY_DN7821_c0_g2_i1.p1  ORF type:complete len:109 (+),score=2.36 TRINITY_DN7821_c0_g2_i1:101-427(+)